MARLFGTDGVRGVANSELTPELAMSIGRAAVTALTKENGKRAKILIGKDTRVSSDMLESALAAGMCSAGADVVLLGFIPTPAVAFLVKEYGAQAGAVISASHNPVQFNGIKFFDANGYKLPDETEDEIERLINEGDGAKRKTGAEVGQISFSAGAVDDYVSHLADCIGCDLKGLFVAVDCANGAAYQTAQKLFSRLGADAVFTAAEPDGRNINDNVGSTHLESLEKLMGETGAKVGIAFDGDADRCLAMDEKGCEIDGDKLIGIIAKYLKSAGKLAKDTAVVTVMTNLGFEEFCSNNGISAVRTAVGDRYVLEEMLKHGYSVGGEQSGHVIISEYATTGDGQLTAVMFLRILKESGKQASELAGEIPRYPQVLKQVAADEEQKAAYSIDGEIAAFIEEQQAVLGSAGRILVRPSGTEPIIRVMAEGRDMSEIDGITDSICATISRRLEK
ncbi:MAG: phosphoglucosamine mutase [Oscillospiraceae bacterium]|nr:phosphoglucosamine mutase [Oscillospiraceae bacterium]